MGRAKEIIIKVIPSAIANTFIKNYHYSGKVVQNSTLHFGAFLDGRLHGVMSFGSPLDKRKVLPLVYNGDAPCLWNEMLELNRMAFDDVLPRNSESRCISIAIKLLKKNAPHIKWILSFSDGTQCGDGSIYRASGFFLTGIIENSNTCQLPSGEVIHKMTLESTPTKKRKELGGISYAELNGSKYDFNKYIEACGGIKLVGYQLRYIYIVDKKCRLNCVNLPYSKIDDLGAGMYKGERISLAQRREKI